MFSPSSRSLYHEITDQKSNKNKLLLSEKLECVIDDHCLVIIS